MLGKRKASEGGVIGSLADIISSWLHCKLV